MFTFMNQLFNRFMHGTRSFNAQQPDLHFPAHRRTVNRQPNTDSGVARIELPDGSWLPASEHELARYYKAEADLATPSLNALDTRSPSYLDIVSYLIDTGRTPASSMDVQEAFVAIHNRLPGPIELETMREHVKDFGLYKTSDSED